MTNKKDYFVVKTDIAANKMPKHISDRDLAPIETLLAARVEGLGIGKIEKPSKIRAYLSIAEHCRDD